MRCSAVSDEAEDRRDCGEGWYPDTASNPFLVWALARIMSRRTRIFKKKFGWIQGLFL